MFFVSFDVKFFTTQHMELHEFIFGWYSCFCCICHLKMSPYFPLHKNRKIRLAALYNIFWHFIDLLYFLSVTHPCWNTYNSAVASKTSVNVYVYTNALQNSNLYFGSLLSFRLEPES